MKQQDYQKYKAFLTESFSQIAKYSRYLGYNQRSINRILKGLNNPDPFISHQALLAATTVLDQDTRMH